MIDSKQRDALIKYRIEQAKLTISETKVLIDNQLFWAVTNRIYSGMRYMVLALGLKYEFET